jgi:predicted nucleic acid-binding protein
VVIYLLDTNAISLLMREDPSMGAWLRAVPDEDEAVTCTVCRGEVLFGLMRLTPGRRRNELEAKAQKLFTIVRCMAVPPSAADHYAAVKLSQQRRGLSLDENDLWIAATALAVDATLVGRDRDFADIAALRAISL